MHASLGSTHTQWPQLSALAHLQADLLCPPKLIRLGQASRKQPVRLPRVFHELLGQPHKPHMIDAEPPGP